jgi:hypothetical protein
MDDTAGEERIEASIKDGQIRVEIDTKGVHLTNEPGCMAEQQAQLVTRLGGINISCRKMSILGKASHWQMEKDINLKVGGDLNLQTKKTLAITASGDVTIEGSTIDLKGSTGVTAEGKMIAVENDPVAGLDMHDIMVPNPSGLTKVPAIPPRLQGRAVSEAHDQPPLYWKTQRCLKRRCLSGRQSRRHRREQERVRSTGPFPHAQGRMPEQYAKRTTRVPVCSSPRLRTISERSPVAV